MNKQDKATTPVDGNYSAFGAGYGYEMGKNGCRVPVKPENQDSFRNGVKKAKAAVARKKSAAHPWSTSSKPRTPQQDQKYSINDKIDYYKNRVNDSKLSAGQREHAARRLGELARECRS